MKPKIAPFLAVLISGPIKVWSMRSTNTHFDIFGWGLFSLVLLQITWAYWKDKNMLAPPNFDYKDGINNLPRGIFVICMTTFYFFGVITA